MGETRDNAMDEYSQGGDGGMRKCKRKRGKRKKGGND